MQLTIDNALGIAAICVSIIIPVAFRAYDRRKAHSELGDAHPVGQRLDAPPRKYRTLLITPGSLDLTVC